MPDSDISKEVELFGRLIKLSDFFYCKSLSNDQKEKTDARLELQNIIYLKESYFSGNINLDQLSGF